MARIYLARTTGIGAFERHVVLKLILPERADDHVAVNMFLDEARLAAMLNHQNIAQVFEVGEDANIHYLAMEYVHGKDLRSLLAQAGGAGVRVPVELGLTIVAGAAAGLNHAHERRTPDGTPLNIVHRDVSPSNIMVGYDGSVKMLDFGIAKAAMRSVHTVSGVIKGKFAYMSPEQCRGREVDRRSDVFSLGILLYEVTTQHRCFRADSDFDTMHRIVTGDVVKPTRLVPGYPVALEAIVMRALSVDPTTRYQSAAALLEALESYALQHRTPLSTMQLGRFMREMFGEVPEPWLVGDGTGDPQAGVTTSEGTISSTHGTEPPARRPAATDPPPLRRDDQLAIGAAGSIPPPLSPAAAAATRAATPTPMSATQRMTNGEIEDAVRRSYRAETPLPGAMTMRDPPMLDTIRDPDDDWEERARSFPIPAQSAVAPAPTVPPDAAMAARSPMETLQDTMPVPRMAPPNPLAPRPVASLHSTMPGVAPARAPMLPGPPPHGSNPQVVPVPVGTQPGLRPDPSLAPTQVNPLMSVPGIPPAMPRARPGRSTGPQLPGPPSAAATVAPTSYPTLASTGMVPAKKPRRMRGVWIGLGLIVVGIGIALVIGGSEDEVKSSPEPAPPPPIDPGTGLKPADTPAVAPPVTPPAPPTPAPPVVPAVEKKEPTKKASADKPPEPDTPPEPAKEPEPEPDDITMEPPAAETVKVVIKSDPPGADVLREGKRVGQTPYEATLPAGEGSTQYTVHADRHVDQTVTVSHEKDTNQTVKLKKASSSSSGGGSGGSKHGKSGGGGGRTSSSAGSKTTPAAGGDAGAGAGSGSAKQPACQKRGGPIQPFGPKLPLCPE